MKEWCFSCKHWSGQYEDKGSECHRSEPRIFLVNNALITSWPKVKGDDFCGEWVNRQKCEPTNF